MSLFFMLLMCPLYLRRLMKLAAGFAIVELVTGRTDKFIHKKRSLQQWLLGS